MFYNEYQNHFPPAREIDIDKLSEFYYSPTPAFNICWGIDQLDMNIIQNLEPERKLRDLAKSAENWKKYFSKQASSLIVEGIATLKEYLMY